MKNGYDQFFRDARKASQGAPPQAAPRVRKNPKSFDLQKESMETPAPRRMKQSAARKARKRSFPLGLVMLSLVGAAAAGAGLLHADELEKFAKRVEIGWIGSAAAEETAPVKKEGVPADSSAAHEADDKTATRAPAATDLDHLSKLNERQKELDAREEELSRQETEIARMKEELEKRLRELNSTRENISEILADRVKVDEQKIETLVQMYSNMKPPQAAKVFETLDEDLAVEILSRMKKKQAADIMNLLKAEKAQVFSEKYSGYKRK